MDARSGHPLVADSALRAHVISDTRPSPFSACNIEKVGIGLGTRLCANQSQPSYSIDMPLHVYKQLCHCKKYMYT